MGNDPACVCGEPLSDHDQVEPRKCLFCDECEGFVLDRDANASAESPAKEQESQ
jgi:hypothetical protein